MRLIDADALELDSEWSEYMDGWTSYSQFQIDNAPTIEAEPVRHWIPVSERLPEKTGYYLVCDSTAFFDGIKGRQDVSKFVIGRHGGHWYGAIRRECITHWMPLPEPPESEAQDNE